MPLVPARRPAVAPVTASPVQAGLAG